MGRDDAPPVESEAYHSALWARIRWLRLPIGREWSPGGHVAAQNEYLRLHALDVSPEEKIRRLIQYLKQRGDADAVEDELARIERIVRLFDVVERPPVKRLRLTARSEK
jgi:hypothetical protein